MKIHLSLILSAILITSALAVPRADRTAKVDAEGVLRWNDDGAEGTVSRPATPEEVAEFVQGIYDDAVYNLLVTMSSTAATERLVESYGLSLFSRVPEIIPLMEEEKKRRMPLYPFFTEGKDRE